jgi:hypothetical protein
MLGFSFSALAVHKKPKIKKRPLANPPSLGSSGMPVVQDISVSQIGDTTADITWSLATSSDGFTLSSVECYRVSQLQGLDPYDASLRAFNVGVKAETGRITVTANSLTNNTSYRIRVKATKYLDSGAIGQTTPWSYYSGTFSTQAVPPGFNGFRDGVWYIDGDPSGLPPSGTGEYNGDHYIQGNPTGLSYVSGLGYCGILGGLTYINGQVANSRYFCPSCSSADLWFVNGGPLENLYFLNGVAVDYTTISAAGGTGNFGGVYYSNYQRYTGDVNGVYYRRGQSTTLNSSGSGTVVNGNSTILYNNGQKFTGLLVNTGVFYVDGKATTLGPDGIGVIDGKYYYAGMYVGEIANPYDSGQTSSQGSRFSAGVTYA